MPFEFQPYRSPLTNTIAQTMLRRGDIAAREAEQSGAGWAQALGLVGQIPGQIQQAKRAGLQDELLAGQVANQQEVRQGQSAVDSMMRGDQLPADQAGPRQPSYLDANGLFDIGKMTTTLGKSGIGHLAPELLKGAEAINDSILKHQQTGAQLAKDQTILLGDLADGATKLAKTGLPVLEAMDFVVQPALATKRLTPQDYARARAHVANLPPDQQVAALGALMDQAAKLAPMKTLAKDALELDRYNRPVASNMVPDKPNMPAIGTPAYVDMLRARELLQQNGGAPPQQTTGAPSQPVIEPDPVITASGTPLNQLPQQRVANSGAIADQGNLPPAEVAPKPRLTEAQAYAQARTEREASERSLQHVSFSLDGKEVQGTFDPRTGKYGYNGEDVTARAKHIQAAAITINAKNEARDAPNRTEMAKGLADGTIVPSMLSRRSSDFNATLAEANRMHIEETGKPLNFTKLELDYKAAQKFTSSLNGSNMVRFTGLAKSVVNTIDEVRTLSEELKQGGVQLWNQAKRDTILKVYGNTPQSELAVRYVAAVNTLKEEYANLANGGFAPTDPAWKLANEQINGNYGFRDLNASLLESQRLINYRLAGFTDLTPLTIGGGSSDTGATINVGGFTVRVVK